MEEIREILLITRNRYRKYYEFGEIDGLEFQCRMAVLEDIEDELDGNAEEDGYDGEE